MPSTAPIPIPAEFDDASVDQKRDYLLRVRDRLLLDAARHSGVVEDALFDVIDERRDALQRDPDLGLSRDALLAPLRKKYAGV